MAAKITNPSIEPCTLPYPFRGVLAGGQSIVLNITPAQALAALVSTVLLVSEVPSTAPYDTTFQGTVGGTQCLKRVTNIPIGPVARASIGTDAAHVAGTKYVSEIHFPGSKIVTGLGILNGTVVGTDNLIVGLLDDAGNVLANSALAGVLSAGADAFQEIAFVTPYTVYGPQRLWVLVQCNGTTAATQRVAANSYLVLAGSSVGVFGTISGVTPPTTFTADMGPIAYAYT